MFGWLEVALVTGAILLFLGLPRLSGLAHTARKSVRYFKAGLRGDDGIRVTKARVDQQSQNEIPKPQDDDFS
ncbi:MAG: hypothetical protein QNJ97_23155 [Myxococcota bacterium]|nr:hypothetical protein [Myxococcota bacterium]